MFEKALRQKFRFETEKGMLTVENLWDLPLTSTSTRPAVNLDDIARGLHRQLKNGDDVSFVCKNRKSDQTIQNKFDIVIHIINTKQAEADAAANKRAGVEKEQQIMAIIAGRDLESLHNTPKEELEKMLQEIRQLK